MEVQYKKHVRVICDLEVGDAVTTDNWGSLLDNKEHIIEDIKEAIGKCESGFRVKVYVYAGYLDSSWFNKVK